MSEAEQSQTLTISSGLHTSKTERLDGVFYIRWTSGPDYERAYICIEDGEPDMNDVACVPFKQAKAFAEAYRFALSRAASQQKQEG